MLGTCIGVSHDSYKGYQLRRNIEKDVNFDQFTDSYSMFSRRGNLFSQLLNILGVNDVRHTEIHTAEPLVPKQSAFEFVFAIEKIKIHKSPNINEITAEFIRAGGRVTSSEIHILIISIWN